MRFLVIQNVITHMKPTGSEDLAEMRISAGRAHFGEVIFEDSTAITSENSIPAALRPVDTRICVTAVTPPEVFVP